MKTKTKKKRGGQPKENPLSARLPEIRATPEQAERFKASAKKQGKSFASWARDLFDKASKKDMN